MDRGHELSVLVHLVSRRIATREIIKGELRLKILDGGRNRLIEDSRSKVDVLLAIQALRLMLTVDIDRKLQQRLRGLPSVLVLWLRCNSRVVTGVVVDHEVVPRNIVRRTVALLKRVEAQAENR